MFELKLGRIIWTYELPRLTRKGGCSSYQTGRGGSLVASSNSLLFYLTNLGIRTFTKRSDILHHVISNAVIQVYSASSWALDGPRWFHSYGCILNRNSWAPLHLPLLSLSFPFSLQTFKVVAQGSVRLRWKLLVLLKVSPRTGTVILHCTSRVKVITVQPRSNRSKMGSFSQWEECRGICAHL